MKNRLLYVSFEDASDMASGVNKKITGHIKAFERSGFVCTIAAVNKKSIVLQRNGEMPVIEPPVRSGRRVQLCGWVKRHAGEFDKVYIRFQFFCPFVLMMLRSLNKADCCIVMEIPTYPYEQELQLKGKKGMPKYICDHLFRKSCAKHIDRFAAPLYGDMIMGRPCIEIRNGIDFSEVSLQMHKSHDGVIHLLAVALMSPWHGYDRLIRGMGLYYAGNGLKRNVALHLVGEGAETNNYRRLTNKLGLSNNVFFHGKLYGKELNDMYSVCDIGVASLAAHRKGITKGNPLKTLEYLAQGMPIIADKTEKTIPFDCVYRLNVPPDETPVDVHMIVDFYDSLLGTGVTEIASDVRQYAEPYCDLISAMHSIIEFYNDIE